MGLVSKDRPCMLQKLQARVDSSSFCMDSPASGNTNTDIPSVSRQSDKDEQEARAAKTLLHVYCWLMPCDR